MTKLLTICCAVLMSISPVFAVEYYKISEQEIRIIESCNERLKAENASGWDTAGIWLMLEWVKERPIVENKTVTSDAADDYLNRAQEVLIYYYEHPEKKLDRWKLAWCANMIDAYKRLKGIEK